MFKKFKKMIKMIKFDNFLSQNDRILSQNDSILSQNDKKFSLQNLLNIFIFKFNFQKEFKN